MTNNGREQRKGTIKNPRFVVQLHLESMDFTKLPIQRNLMAEIKDGVLTYDEFHDEFLRIKAKPTKTQEDFQFLRDGMEVLKEDPKKLSRPK